MVPEAKAVARWRCVLRLSQRDEWARAARLNGVGFKAQVCELHGHLSSTSNALPKLGLALTPLPEKGARRRGDLLLEVTPLPGALVAEFEAHAGMPSLLRAQATLSGMMYGRRRGGLNYSAYPFLLYNEDAQLRLGTLGRWSGDAYDGETVQAGDDRFDSSGHCGAPAALAAMLEMVAAGSEADAAAGGKGAAAAAAALAGKLAAVKDDHDFAAQKDFFAAGGGSHGLWAARLVVAHAEAAADANVAGLLICVVASTKEELQPVQEGVRALQLDCGAWHGSLSRPSSTSHRRPVAAAAAGGPDGGRQGCAAGRVRGGASEPAAAAAAAALARGRGRRGVEQQRRR